MSIHETMFRITYQEKCTDKNVFFDPRFLHADFEKVEITAAYNVFGSDLVIKECFYHQCLRAFCKIQELRLQTTYMINDKLNYFCLMIKWIPSTWSSPWEVRILKKKKKQLLPQTNELLNYFEITNIKFMYKKIETSKNLKLRKKNALFPPYNWNIFYSTMKKELI